MDLAQPKVSIMSHKLIHHIIGTKRFFVYKINEVYFQKRLFCIFDKNKPFELTIVYKEMNKSTEMGPVVVGGKLGFFLYDSVNFETEYVFRLTEDECKENIDEIKKKRILVNEQLNHRTDVIFKNLV